MFTVANFVRFIMAAATATACGVLLLSPSSSSPCSGRSRPGQLELVPSGTNGTQHAEPSIKAALVDATEADIPAPLAVPEDDIAVLLRSAAMEDNTVIMTFTNKAWTAAGSLLDLFLESFRGGDKTEPLLKHLIIVAVDGEAFERCKLVHPLCYSLDVGSGVNMTSEKPYMTKDYVAMMWVRNKFQTRVLELGHTFLFTDMDIVWFRNALLHVPVGADITISSDKYNGEAPYDGQAANGGFLYARSNARTIAFFKGWYEARTAHPRQHDQYVFDRVKQELSLRHAASVHFIDTAYFGGFCQPKKDFRRLCTFHGNCLRGLSLKQERLRGILDEWKQYKIARQREANNTTSSSQ